MSKLEKVANGLGALGGVVAALSLRITRNDDRTWQTVEVIGVPVWDRDWPGPTRRRARREARRAARERDAP